MKAGSASRRVSGGIWITVLFAPWIAYWVLCGLGSPTGVLVGLALSVAVYALGPDKRSIMSLTTLVYFAIAFIWTFIFSSHLFAEYSGLLGYGALCIMALASLALKNPYTYEVSKRDYPEVYWSTPEFFKVNALLTAIWALVFLLCALVQLLPFPLKLASHAFIAVGIVASAVLPKVLVSRSARRLAPAYSSWEAPREPKEVIIVGAGIGGLACGALLAERGYRVTVLEQCHQVGGYCTSFRRRGFVFDGGVESISGLGPRGPLRYLLTELGYDPDELFVRTEDAYVIEGEWVKIPPDFDRFVESLCEKFPEEADNIRQFFSEVREAYREMYKEVELVGTPLPQPLLTEVLGPEYLLRYPEEHPTFYRILSSGETLKDALDRYFKSEELKKLLCALTAYLGTRPEETLLSSMLPIYGYYIDGGYYPRGGSQALANLLAQAIEGRGGRVLTRHKVERVVIQEGAVKGVVANGGLFEAPIVILNTNAMNLLDLVGEENLPSDYVEHLRSLRPSVTAFLVYLGLDVDLSEKYPPLIKSLDDEMGIVINSNLDPSLAPEGCSSLAIVRLLPPEAYDYFGERGTPEYLEKKRAFADQLVALAEKLVPEIKGHVVVRDAATPRTLERYTLNPKGIIYGLDQSANSPERPYFKTPVRGLYLVGASTFPGGGIEAVAISGIISANDISGWPLRKQ